jgi:hypothetical protein
MANVLAELKLRCYVHQHCFFGDENLEVKLDGSDLPRANISENCDEYGIINFD